jgi:lipid-binding SYLF domain-containing protein
MTSNKEFDVPQRKRFRLTRAGSRKNAVTMKVFASVMFAVGMVTVATAATEQQLVDESVNTLRAFYEMPERRIPPSIMRNARGLAIIRVFKGGFIFSGKGGQGVLVARTANGWSGPSFIGLGGAGWGLQAGGEMTDFIFVLNNDRAVRAFSREGNLKLGADLSAAAGPWGRDLQGAVTTTAAVYTYSRSKGLFAGASLEGAVIATQNTANNRYYGQAAPARAILAGDIPPPQGAEQLRELLSRY